MEVRLENLIEKIKAEGVDNANKQAEEILAKAKAEAATIVANAKKEALSITQNGEKSAENLKNNAEAAIAQAARDTILSLKSKIQQIFDSILKANVSKTLDENFLKDLILKTVDALAQGKKVDVAVGGVDAGKLAEMVASCGIKTPLEIKLDSRIKKGFKVSVQGTDVSYDLSDTAIAEAMGLFLNSKITDLMK